jgi:hypothetical protein
MPFVKFSNVTKSCAGCKVVQKNELYDFKKL